MLDRPVFTVSTPSGAALAVEHIPAEGPPAGAAWVAHAMMANRRSLDRPRGAGLASRLAAAGIHVYLADLLGHGASAPAPHWTFDEIVREDLPALGRFVRARHPDLPVAAVGHSLTAYGVLASAGDPQGSPPLDAIVSIAGNPWLRTLEPSPLVWAVKRFTMEGFRAIAARVGRFPARAIGMGTEDVSLEFVEAISGWSASGRFLARDGTDWLAGLSRVTAPVLAVFGAGDVLNCRPACGERFHRRLTRAPVDVLLAGRETLGFDPGHMGLVTDPRAWPLWEEIARWLARRLLVAKSSPRE